MSLHNNTVFICLYIYVSYMEAIKRALQTRKGLLRDNEKTILQQKDL